MKKIEVSQELIDKLRHSWKSGCTINGLFDTIASHLATSQAELLRLKWALPGLKKIPVCVTGMATHDEYECVGHLELLVPGLVVFMPLRTADSIHLRLYTAIFYCRPTDRLCWTGVSLGGAQNCPHPLVKFDTSSWPWRIIFDNTSASFDKKKLYHLTGDDSIRVMKFLEGWTKFYVDTTEEVTA
jgi:hypothetical protein